MVPAVVRHVEHDVQGCGVRDFDERLGLVDRRAKDSAHSGDHAGEWGAQRRELLRPVRQHGRGLCLRQVRGRLIGVLLRENAGLDEPDRTRIGVLRRGEGNDVAPDLEIGGHIDHDRHGEPGQGLPSEKLPVDEHAEPIATEAGGCATAASGDVSVMPQAWMMRTPYFFSKFSMSERGTAEPPQTIIRMLDRSMSCSSPYR